MSRNNPSLTQLDFTPDLNRGAAIKALGPIHSNNLEIFSICLKLPIYTVASGC